MPIGVRERRRYTRHHLFLASVVRVMNDDELLSVLTLSEAQDVMDVLAAVVAGQRVDGEMAERLLSELAARVPSRDEAR
ncbi:hypothetical protein ACFYO9_37440 [Streptomyces sp. NPDC005863]|uniref:hypothetical protein n=1 Tax=Streptomyces sp. NPDC005863 TaxID=3364735 RepID=UPI0036BE4A3C